MNVDEDKRAESIASNKEHISKVRDILRRLVAEIRERGRTHDASKLEAPELEVFAQYTHRLKGLTYGSDEYRACLEGMKPALDHHYANNRHHPEHHERGIDGMNLVDLIEMMADWYAATLRHNDGDIHRSIEHNRERFKISPQLEAILVNTIPLLIDET